MSKRQNPPILSEPPIAKVNVWQVRSPGMNCEEIQVNEMKNVKVISSPNKEGKQI